MNIETKKIKILYLTHSLTWGGLEKVIFQLGKYLDKNIYQIIVVYWKDGDYYETYLKEAGIEVIRIKSYIWSAKFIFSVAKIIREKNIDIVHSWFPDEDLVSIISSLLSFKKVYRVASFQVPFFVKKLHFLRYKIIGRLFRKIICCSEWYRQLILRGCGLENFRVITIHNSVDLRNFPNKPSDYEIKKNRSEFGIKEEDKLILCAARLSPEKGIDILIEAMSIIKKHIPHVKLLIVGDGPQKTELISQVRKLDLVGDVIFAGFRKDIEKIYYLSDIFVLPSREEPFGIVLIEAMTAKKPICATRVGGIPELVEDGKNGILVNAGDVTGLAKSIIQLLSMPKSELEKMGEKGYLLCKEKFSVEKMVSLYEKTYLDISKDFKEEEINGKTSRRSITRNTF
jgi:glycosyltransferase involved in cell wall biosynthesis